MRARKLMVAAVALAALAAASCMAGMIAQRRQEFVASHPGLSMADRESILHGEVRIGMTEDEAVAAWGEPDEINRTTAASGVTEQWVYDEYDGYGNAIPKNFLYFTNGLLTTIQN